MSTETTHEVNGSAQNGELAKTQEFLTIMIADQRFGVPILQVQDVLGQQSVTRIPLAPPEVAGSLNLRGRIVTAIDVRTRLNIVQDSQNRDLESKMSVVVEHDQQLYSLIIDRVGDVMALRDDQFESNPPTMDTAWRDISAGIFRLHEELLVILDVPKLLESVHN